MTTYVYRCPTHGDHDQDWPFAQAPIRAGCLRCGSESPRNVGVVQLAPWSQETEDTKRREARWQRDHSAVRTLAKQGIVPGRLEGAADLVAAARDRTEIEMGYLHPTESKASIRDASELMTVTKANRATQ